MGGSKKKAQQKGGKKNRKIGRGKKAPAHMRYNVEHRREKNKVHRMLASNGIAFTLDWIRARNLDHLFVKTINSLEEL